MNTTPRLDRAAFGRRLTQIRAEGLARREQVRHARSSTELLRSQKMMGAFAFLDEVDELALECLDQMAGELSGSPKVSRTVFDGRYMAVLRHDEHLADPSGMRGRFFTRLAFLLEPHHDDDTFAIEVRATVRGRDITGGHFTVSMNDDDALARLAAFIETRALAFAQRYFESEGFTAIADEPEAKPEAVAWLDESYAT